MSIYLLAITPAPISDDDYEKAFLNLIGCNPAYEDTVWSGVITFCRVPVGNLWASLIQMNDQAVRDDGMLTVVWAADPFNHLVDRRRDLYQQRRQEIHDYVDTWAVELASERTVGLLYDGQVCWVLENASTDLLNEDFAGEKRSRFQLVHSKSQK
jgi:hypothetical protein